MLDPERYQRIDDLFQAVLELRPEERAGFLAEACAGDEGLRKEVERLLATDEQGWEFIEQPAFVLAAGLLARERPQLSEGQEFAHYKVVSILGKGGMGEVYLAQDSRLARKVALKLLPADFTDDEEWVRRFQREAQAISALNHPGILTIHEVGEADGLHYLATEFVEGETLRQRLRRGKLGLSQALEIAIQIARALSAAHQAGIIHRDIKPENIMLRPDDYVKVLDFGLAKLVDQQEPGKAVKDEAEPGNDGSSGLLLGTITYMSPEQASGKEVDGRSDVFSFGVVLYEMITGSAPFGGETTSDLIALILKVEPPPLSEYLPDAPSEAERIISKALSKDKEERYPAISDMLADLKGLKQEIEHGPETHQAVQTGGNNSAALATSRSRAAVQTADQPALSTGGAAAGRAALSIESLVSNLKSHLARAAIVLAMLAVVVAAIGYGIYRLIGTSKASHFQSVKISRITTTGKANSPAVSPDGRYVAYLDSDGKQQNLWIRQLATASNTLVASSTHIQRRPTFSPDGNYLYYVAQEQSDSEPGVYQMPTLGGIPKKVGDVVNSAVAVSPDGKRLAFEREYAPDEAAIIVANADGSDERKVATRKLPEYFLSVAWSPDGKRLACVGGGRDETGFYGDVVEMSAEGTGLRPITDRMWSWCGDVAWLSDGSSLLIIASDKTGSAIQIWQVSYPGGEARRITTDLNDYVGLSVTKDSSAIVSTQSITIFNLYVQEAGDSASAAQVTSGSARMDGLSGIAWTPDGRVVYSSAANGSIDVWSMEPDGSNLKQLTVGLGSSQRGLSVSPDGRYIVFISTKAEGPQIWRVDIDGSNPKQLTHGLGGINPFVSPDNQWVYYFDTANQSRAWKVPIDGGEPVQLTRPFFDIVPRGFSPDGKLFAFKRAGVPAETKLGIASAETGETIKILEMPPTSRPRNMQWMPDGKAITYLDNRKGVSNLWMQPVDGGPPKQLTDFKDYSIYFFAWSPDGKHLVFNRGFQTSDIVLINSTR